MDKGNLKYSIQDYQGAIEDYTQAISINPGYAWAYNNRAMGKNPAEEI